jgi:hypothetical protein
MKMRWRYLWQELEEQSEIGVRDRHTKKRSDQRGAEQTHGEWVLYRDLGWL